MTSHPPARSSTPHCPRSAQRPPRRDRHRASLRTPAVRGRTATGSRAPSPFAALVLVYHLFPGILPGGFIGVDVFFVISGFLITSLLMRERSGTGRIDLRRFWVRRARRLRAGDRGARRRLLRLPRWLSAAMCSSGSARQILGAATFSANWLVDRRRQQLLRPGCARAVPQPLVACGRGAVLPRLAARHPRRRAGAPVVGDGSRSSPLVAVASAVAMFALYSPGGDPTRVYFGSDTHSFGLAHRRRARHPDRAHAPARPRRRRDRHAGLRPALAAAARRPLARRAGRRARVG